jgi:hypothetical protein
LELPLILDQVMIKGVKGAFCKFPRLPCCHSFCEASAFGTGGSRPFVQTLGPQGSKGFTCKMSSTQAQKQPESSLNAFLNAFAAFFAYLCICRFSYVFLCFSPLFD